MLKITDLQVASCKLSISSFACSLLMKFMTSYQSSVTDLRRESGSTQSSRTERNSTRGPLQHQNAQDRDKIAALEDSKKKLAVMNIVLWIDFNILLRIM